MNFEKLFYEARPYGLVIIGLYALKSQSTFPMMTVVSSALLLLCAGTILYWRHSQRSKPITSGR